MEFEKFMKDLEDFSQSPSAGNKDQDAFKTGIKGYLDLIEISDPSGSRDSETPLPEISLPSRMGDIMNKLMQTPEKDASQKKSLAPVGKVKSFFSLGTKAESQAEEKTKQKPISNDKANKIKRMFEEKPSKMSRTMSELNLWPEKKKQVLIEAPPIQQVS